LSANNSDPISARVQAFQEENHEITAAPRSRRGQATRGGAQDQRRHHHSGHSAEKPQTGRVVAAGAGARGEDGKLQPMGVKSGDKVLFGKWSGTEVKIDGEELLIMKESDIMGILG
jgi:co-chaperonin GroES (HSP10)